MVVGKIVRLFEQCLLCPFVSGRMMEVVYRFEQSIVCLCVFQTCDNHTTSLHFLAVFVVAV
jgi:hypothetical protein